MEDLIADFKQESSRLIKELTEILDEIEGDFSQVEKLERYGQIVDRMMGGAKSLAMALEDPQSLNIIGNYAELCKLVGYKGSQIQGSEQFYDIVVALLQDATEMLEELVSSLNDQKDQSNIQELLTDTFLDRLKWVSQHFDENTRASLEISGESGKTSQEEIDALLKQLGV